MLDLKLLRECRRVLDSLLGIENSLKFGGEYKQGAPAFPDAIVYLDLPNLPSAEVCIEAKKVLRPAMLPQIKHQFTEWLEKGFCKRALILSEYIPTPLAGHLREEGIWFVDAAGNAYLEVPGSLLIYATGNRSRRIATTRGKYFTTGGARVLFYLLKHGPTFVVTYRELSAAASVSLDIISKVINELIYDAVITRSKPSSYEVRHPQRLLAMWTEAFTAKLLPKITLGHYKSAYGTDFQTIIHEGLQKTSIRGIVVGGEYAADLLTQYLRAKTMSLYVPAKAFKAVIRNLKLAPSEKGPITMCEKFSTEITGNKRKDGIELADPALVYAELLASNDPRCGETALMVKENYLPWIP